jgi:flagellar hook protein FlgE
MFVYGPNVSALRAFSIKLQSTANNTANMLTDGYKRTRVEFADQKHGGVTATVTRDLTPGTYLPPQPGTPNPDEPRETSNVNLVQETVDLIVTQRAFQANARFISTMDETTGSIIDIIK